MCKCVCVCVFVFVFVFVSINAGISGIRTVRYWKKITKMPGQVRYRTKPRQSGIFLVRYRTVIIDAGMPMPALVSWMPMPSYDIYVPVDILFVGRAVKGEKEKGIKAKR